jgi:hypothetical protein
MAQCSSWLTTLLGHACYWRLELDSAVAHMQTPSLARVYTIVGCGQTVPFCDIGEPRKPCILLGDNHWSRSWRQTQSRWSRPDSDECCSGVWSRNWTRSSQSRWTGATLALSNWIACFMQELDRCLNPNVGGRSWGILYAWHAHAYMQKPRLIYRVLLASLLASSCMRL